MYLLVVNVELRTINPGNNQHQIVTEVVVVPVTSSLHVPMLILSVM